MNPASQFPRLTVPGHLRAGEMLGGYQLLCPIAKGGMGQVWAACRTTVTGTDLVAIKTTLPRLNAHGQGKTHFEMLFLDEARIATSIEHPNVCRTYELGQDRELLFLAMEWIDGASLANLVAEMRSPQRLDACMAAHIVSKACAGLHAVHELRGADGSPLSVVHRDATPQNILISSEGDVKLVDFGVVQARGQLHQATLTGELRGKIAYLAPEQLLSARVDRRADVFALGCVLYLVSTGKRAFEGDSPEATMLRIARGEYVLPSRLVADYPVRLEAILVRALADEPSDRFQSAEEMRSALDGFIRDSGRMVERDDVASVLRSTLGASIEERQREIRLALKVFESQRASCGRTRIVRATDPVRHDDRVRIPPSGRYSVSPGQEAEPTAPSPRSMRSRFATVPDLVARDRADVVGADRADLVGADRADVVRADRADVVGADRADVVGAERATLVAADRAAVVAMDRPGVAGESHRRPPSRHRVLVAGPVIFSAVGGLLVLGAFRHRVERSFGHEALASRADGISSSTRPRPAQTTWSSSMADESIVTFPTPSLVSDSADRATSGERPSVGVSLQTIPPHANLSLDDGPFVSTPRAFLVPADRRLHVVRVGAPGYVPLVAAIRFDDSQSFEFELTPQAAKRPVTAKHSDRSGRN